MSDKCSACSKKIKSDDGIECESSACDGLYHEKCFKKAQVECKNCNDFSCCEKCEDDNFFTCDQCGQRAHDDCSIDKQLRTCDQCLDKSSDESESDNSEVEDDDSPKKAVTVDFTEDDESESDAESDEDDEDLPKIFGKLGIKKN